MKLRDHVLAQPSQRGPSRSVKPIASVSARPPGRADTGLLHDWWNPAIKYPNLLLLGDDGEPLQSCRRCGFMQTSANIDRANCPGIVHVTLR